MIPVPRIWVPAGSAKVIVSTTDGCTWRLRLATLTPVGVGTAPPPGAPAALSSPTWSAMRSGRARRDRTWRRPFPPPRCRTG